MAEEDKNEEAEELDDDLDLDDDGGDQKGKRKLLIIIAAVLLIGGGAAGAYFAGLFDDSREAPPAAYLVPEGGGVVHPNAAPKKISSKPIFYKMPGLVVNLNSGGKRSSFLKVTITLELPNPEVAKVVDELQPRIEDSFLTYLREIRPSDLAGSAGIYRLREELLVRVNKAIYPEQVNDILFKEIIVQ